MSEQDNGAEAIISEEELELDLTPADTEDVETLKAQLSEALTAKSQLTARAKKAEADLKEAKAPKKVEAPRNINKDETLSEDKVHTAVLKAQGMSEDLLKELRVIAQVRGKSLLDSINDPLFVAIKTEKEEEAKTKGARLGASRGSAPVKKEKELNSPNISDEDHKELWRQSQNK